MGLKATTDRVNPSQPSEADAQTDARRPRNRQVRVDAASLQLGATSYLTKPVDADQILAAFDNEPRSEKRPVPSAQPLARVEWEHIQRVLADCDGNVSQAARSLGLHRRSLQRKLSKNPVSEA